MAETLEQVGRVAAVGVVAYVALLVMLRVSGKRTLVKAEPTLLVADGRILGERLRRQRVAIEEVRQVVRASGVGDLSMVAAVVLETDGSLSVIEKSAKGNGEALADVDMPQDIEAERS